MLKQSLDGKTTEAEYVQRSSGSRNDKKKGNRKIPSSPGNISISSFSTFHRKEVLMKEDTNCWKVTLNSHLELKIRFQFGDFIWYVKYFNVTYISDIELHKPKIALQKFPDGYCGLQYSKVLIKRLYEICVIPLLELLGITQTWKQISHQYFRLPCHDGKPTKRMKYYHEQNLTVEKNALCSEIRKDWFQVLELKKAAH